MIEVFVRHFPISVVLAGICLVALPGVAAAQYDSQSPASRALGGDSAPGNAAVPGGSSGTGRHARSEPESAPGDMPALKPIVEPRQRLDVGALLCHTEAELKQHQAAIMARLAGRTAQEPGGCHIVGETIPVGVVMRDGQGTTEVQMVGDPPQTGWTDAVVQDADPLKSAIR
jgi:hypothetical protein